MVWPLRLGGKLLEWYFTSLIHTVRSLLHTQGVYQNSLSFFPDFSGFLGSFWVPLNLKRYDNDYSSEQSTSADQWRLEFTKRKFTTDSERVLCQKFMEKTKSCKGVGDSPGMHLSSLTFSVSKQSDTSLYSRTLETSFLSPLNKDNNI